MPSYTPPQNRGGDGVLMVAFGYPKEGEKRIKDLVHKAGFTKFKRAAQTPFNIVYEAKP